MKPCPGLVSNPNRRLAFRRETFDPLDSTVNQRRANKEAACNCPFRDFKGDFRFALSLRLKCVEHVHNVGHFPKTIRDASGHRGADFERLVQPYKIVVHRMERDRACVVFNLL